MCNKIIYIIQIVTLMAGFALLAPSAQAEVSSEDPLKSVLWEWVKKEHFGTAKVVFDDRVKVTAPALAEDSMNVPVAVSIEGLADVQEVLVLVDLNPIKKVLQFYPEKTKAYLAFRLKLEQSSAIRAAARTSDGVWHVGGVNVAATGGGCSVPSGASQNKLWESHLNEVQGKVWPNAAGSQRVRARIVHPMDTGLASGIPAFFIQKLDLSDDVGTHLMRIETFEPVSENPVFTFDIGNTNIDKLWLTGIDNNGNKIRAQIKS
ncbi:MAG: quinoprotein dehydrogenase-associated SoxYZ-like carrier [Burkholderiales bacterium]